MWWDSKRKSRVVSVEKNVDEHQRHVSVLPGVERHWTRARHHPLEWAAGFECAVEVVEQDQQRQAENQLRRRQPISDNT